VLLGDSLASLGTTTVDIDGSDHYGLIATVATPWLSGTTQSSSAGTASGTARPGRAGRS
jgi:hypothetical protein